MANSTVLPDEDGDFQTGLKFQINKQPIDLGGYHLTDDGDDPEKWTFPRISLPANSSIIVSFGKDRTVKVPLHTDFELNAKGEYLALISKDNKTILTEFSPVFHQTKTSHMEQVALHQIYQKTL